MRLFMVMLVFAFLHNVALAQDHAQYCDKADSSAAMMECVKSHHEAAQNALNKAYEALSTDLNSEALKMLQTLQSQWLSYRDAECRWERERTESEALKQLYLLSCEARLSQNRADILQANFENDQSRDPIAFSGFPRWMNALSKDYTDVFWRVGGRERIDLNCDGQDEIVMAGTALAPQKIDADDVDQDDSNKTIYEPYAMDGVLAVITNPDKTGRPDAQIFRIPVGENGDNISVCSPILTILPHKAGENQTGGEETSQACSAHIVVKNRSCPKLELRWIEKDYAINQQDTNTAESIK